MDKFQFYDQILKSKTNYSFLPCKNSLLCKKKMFIQSNNSDENHKLNHKVLKLCNDYEINYFTCVYANDTPAHMCDFLPVQLGSELDKSIHHKLFPNDEYYCDKDLVGYFFIESLSHIPNVLTNRKQIIHKTSSISEICLYVYDKFDKGHFFSLNPTHKIMKYKNHKGEISDVNKSFKFSQPIQIDDKHLDPERFVDGFKLFVVDDFNKNIDNISNKVALSWINIIEKIFTTFDIINHNVLNNIDEIIKRNEEDIANKITTKKIKIKSGFFTKHKDIKKLKTIRTTLTRGELELFCSQNIDFEQARRDKLKMVSLKTGFSYRKKFTNQISYDQKIGCDIVARPVPKNVPRSNIPSGTNYFFCPIDRNISIDLPSRWMLLLNDVYVSNTILISKYPQINEIIEILLNKGAINIKSQFQSTNNIIPITVMGGLMTKYYIHETRLNDFHMYIKSINPFVEVIIKKKFVLINLECGIMYKKINENLYVSPLEYAVMFDKYKDYFEKCKSVFGQNNSKNIEKYAAYISPEKTISANNYLKNRFSYLNDCKFFSYTNENLCAFIKDVKDSSTNTSIYDPETSMINPSVVFSGDPQITADGYIMDKNINIEALMCKQLACELTYEGHMNILMNEDMEKGGLLITSKCSKFIKVCDIFIINGSVIKLNSNSHNLKCEQIVDKYKSTKIVMYLTINESYFIDNDDKLCIKYKITREQNRKRIQSVTIKLNISSHIVNYDGEKISNDSGQKGMIVRQSTLGKMFDKKERPNVVASIFSIINRQPILQLKLMKTENDNIIDRNSILYGKQKFAVLKNVTSTMKHNSHVRIDNYSVKILATNNVHKTQYYMYQQSFKKKSDIEKFLPEENENAYNMSALLKINILFEDAFNNKMFLSKLTSKEEFEKTNKAIEDIRSKRKRTTIKKRQTHKPKKNVICPYVQLSV